MKVFDIITEADARVLPQGESVMLARKGHITPLAADTLRERRITVVREGMSSPEEVAIENKKRRVMDLKWQGADLFLKKLLQATPVYITLIIGRWLYWAGPGCRARSFPFNRRRRF